MVIFKVILYFLCNVDELWNVYVFGFNSLEIEFKVIIFKIIIRFSIYIKNCVFKYGFIRLRLFLLLCRVNKVFLVNISSLNFMVGLSKGEFYGWVVINLFGD